MKRFRAMSLLTALLMLVSIGLSACGDPAPTATPVPPTSTPRPAATATTPPPQSRVATSAEVALIEEVLGGINDLETYHFDIEIKPSTFVTQPVQAEGDYEAPDLVYVKGTMGKENFENIAVGDVVFEKNSSGDYVIREDTTDPNDPTAAFNPSSMVSNGNPLESISEFADAVSEYQYEGDVQVEGVKVKHFTFDLDLAKMLGTEDTEGMDLSGLDLGGGGFYIDENEKKLYGVEYNLDVGAILELFVRAFSGLMGTPTPGGAKPTPLPKLELNMLMKITRHDDPSIKVPVTDEMRDLMAQPTEEPTEEPTEVIEETPFVEETPEVGETPEPSETNTPGSQPSSGVFEVLDPVYLTTDFGFAYVVGVIKYNGSEIRAQPDIVATITDSSGQVLATEDAFVKPGILVPGKIIPYQALFSSPPDNASQVEVTISADIASDFDLEYSYYDFETEGTSLVKPKGQFDDLKVVGRVKNTGDQTATLVQIIGVAYDASGKVVDVNSAYSQVDEIPAGETSPFELSFSNAKDAASYELVVTGWPQR